MAIDEAGDDLRDRFRRAFRRYPAAVTVITYLDAAGHPSGMTATAVCSLSIAPPSVIVCVNRDARAHAAITQGGRFGINLLALGQEHLATHCSRPGAEKTLQPEWISGSGGAHTPVLRGALAHLDCTVRQHFEAYTHSVVIGEVTLVQLGPAAMPLVYAEGSYRTLDAAIEQSYEVLWDRMMSRLL
ncbi:MAG TPA: flavin reductase family protein [bacterium]|nr:flavin reductase family protein [bacterium]